MDSYINIYKRDPEKFWRNIYKYYLRNIHIKSIYILLWLYQKEREGREIDICQITSLLSVYPKLRLLPEKDERTEKKIEISKGTRLLAQKFIAKGGFTEETNIENLFEALSVGRIKIIYPHLRGLLCEKDGGASALCRLKKDCKEKLTLLWDYLIAKYSNGDKLYEIIRDLNFRFLKHGDPEGVVDCLYVIFLYTKYSEKCKHTGVNFRKYLVHPTVLRESLRHCVKFTQK
jgi:hypothetical protein